MPVAKECGIPRFEVIQRPAQAARRVCLDKPNRIAAPHASPRHYSR